MKKTSKVPTVEPTTQNKETGAAQINIELTNSRIIVRHTNKKGEILYEKDAVKGDWNKIWDALRNVSTEPQSFNKKREDLIKKCEWLGEFVKLHELGEYSIVEYKSIVFDGCGPASPRQYETESSFHPYVGDRNTHCSYDSLEAAIAGAIAFKYDGGNSQAGKFFMKMIKPD